MSLSLEQETELCRLLADSSRLRLLAVLETHALSTTELTEITGLAQSRVSTHLARLSQAGLIHTQRVGAANRYAVEARNSHAADLWHLLREHLDDTQTRLDLERAQQVVQNRKASRTWAESVAGRMELHYSPGRTWEATARALAGLIHLGHSLDVGSGDGVLADLIAAHSSSVTCLDISDKVLAAARRRLTRFDNVRLCRGDMHIPPFSASSFNHIFLMHALVYTTRPGRVIQSLAPLLKPHGRLVIATLNAHHHRAAMKAYDHVNLGMTAAALQELLAGAGLEVVQCAVTSREVRPPYFEVITALAERH
ncbi:MAG: methyltransferase domain-containing protein [Nevskiaceae bacterium]|nr:MAG: methyltransferase domain-containing protein [Nevskiaceae bacterium]TBR74119.1 MAG: methyltransferase domain-containing protein [Nevskiaceae bacterium]